ncbi:MAG: hypothetical protein KGD63_09025 [Candidatus Lokiarchaeota archaeon]|nr:hypothetical protein [Candidatus Lokiarchaeota archaeon]
MDPKDQLLSKQFKRETGKNAIWKGKETEIFVKWKKEYTKKQKKDNEQSLTLKSSTMDSILILEIQKDIKQIFNKIDLFESRIKNLEEKIFIDEKKLLVKEISTDILLQTIKDIYNSSGKLIGDFVPISTIVEKLKNNFSWPIEKIQKEIFKLFNDYKIQLIPGKTSDKHPFIQDGKIYAWFKLID